MLHPTSLAWHRRDPFLRSRARQALPAGKARSHQATGPQERRLLASQRPDLGRRGKNNPRTKASAKDSADGAGGHWNLWRGAQSPSQRPWRAQGGGWAAKAAAALPT